VRAYGRRLGAAPTPIAHGPDRAPRSQPAPIRAMSARPATRALDAPTRRAPATTCSLRCGLRNERTAWISGSALDNSATAWRSPLRSASTGHDVAKPLSPAQRLHRVLTPAAGAQRLHRVTASEGASAGQPRRAGPRSPAKVPSPRGGIVAVGRRSASRA